MKGLKSITLLSVFYVICFYTNAQTSPVNDFIVSGQGHYGYIISHRHNMGNLIKGHISGVELNYIFRTDGSKTWHQIHNYPEVGLCALHMYLANPKQLGNMEAIYPYANIRLNNCSKKIGFNLRLGLGLTYITKPFDRIENHQNAAIGSHLNGFVNIRLAAHTYIKNAWRLDAGVGLTHASNGAYSTPNLGLNLATVNLGLGYAFGNKLITCKKDTISKCSKSWEPSIIFVTGIKELEAPEGPKYMAYGLQANFYKTINHKTKLGGGLEFTYNTATKQVWINDSVPNPSFSDILQVGTKLSYSFNMHRLSLPIDFGVYVFKKQDFNGMFFHRIGIRYLVTKHLIANVTLLTHFAKADYFEWGIGYKF
jgi:hypothetical protein